MKKLKMYCFRNKINSDSGGWEYYAPERVLQRRGWLNGLFVLSIATSYFDCLQFIRDRSYLGYSLVTWISFCDIFILILAVLCISSPVYIFHVKPKLVIGKKKYFDIYLLCLWIILCSTLKANFYWWDLIQGIGMLAGFAVFILLAETYQNKVTLLKNLCTDIVIIGGIILLISLLIAPFTTWDSTLDRVGLISGRGSLSIVALSVLACGFLIIPYNKNHKKYIFIFFIILSCLSILYSGSRTGVIGVLLTICFNLFNKKCRNLIIIVLIGVVCFSLISVKFQSYQNSIKYILGQRLVQTRYQLYHGVDRLKLWEEYYKEMCVNPFLGITRNDRSNIGMGAHNLFVENFAIYGLPGGIIFLFICFKTIVVTITSKLKEQKHFICGLMVYLIPLLLFISDTFNVHSPVFWILCIIIITARSTVSCT